MTRNIGRLYIVSRRAGGDLQYLRTYAAQGLEWSETPQQIFTRQEITEAVGIILENQLLLASMTISRISIVTD